MKTASAVFTRSFRIDLLGSIPGKEEKRRADLETLMLQNLIGAPHQETQWHFQHTHSCAVRRTSSTESVCSDVF
jgi:hypothetical protein